ncbi:DUF4123 domain-containing protein [Parasulfitobacter algicola]|uniref:DUF4123 domain-containing protein n=1 Tax=Parasulfitobacter algicola TaxID=2614809 RepID=A0ABX2IY96_9RHOB|nr:DUF4123 domain-containing protein [Sulfitobacter algicola]NSX55554.1 DUF4123 domain-containing protein [Sulfitobacter algicola]
MEKSGVQAEPPVLIVETISGITPLDDQFGVDDKKTVPTALYDLFFGHLDPSDVNPIALGDTLEDVPHLQTYAILDAAKVTNLPELLAMSELEHRCLFKGQAEDNLRSVAPWIVKLEEGNAFTRHLFTHENDVPWYLWDKEPGIYIRSLATLDQLWKHFRKFTRLQDENGKLYYQRFYDPRVLKYHLEGIQYSSERTKQLFHVRSAEDVARLITIKDNTVHIFQINPDTDTEQETIQPVLELDIRYTETFLRDSIVILRGHTPELISIPDDDLLWIARTHLMSFHHFDLKTKPVIANALAITCLIGKPLTDLPSEDQAILQTPGQSQFKRTTTLLQMIKTRINTSNDTILPDNG